MTALASDLLQDYRPRRAQLWPTLLFWLVWGLLRWQLGPGTGQRVLGVTAQFWLAYSVAWWALSAVATGRLAMRDQRVWLIGAGLAPNPYRVRQGTCVGADGRVFLSSLGDDVWVAGQVVPCIQGQIEL